MEFQEETRIAHCAKHGEYEAKALAGTHISTGCPDCEASRAAQQAAERSKADSEAKARRVRKLTSGALIPKRFQSYGFDDYEPANDKARKILAACKRYAENFEDRLSMGGGLVFCGKPGTGKTHLACAIGNHVMREHLRVVLFTSITKMSRAIKATYARDSQRTEEQVIRDFVEPDLLILDEVGAQRGTETELLLAQEIIDERYQAVKPTILISNLAESELGEYIGERALDRMYEGGGAVFAFDWESFRRGGKSRRFEHPEPEIHGPRDVPASPHGRY